MCCDWRILTVLTIHGAPVLFLFHRGTLLSWASLLATFSRLSWVRNSLARHALSRQRDAIVHSRA